MSLPTSDGATPCAIVARRAGKPIVSEGAPVRHALTIARAAVSALTDKRGNAIASIGGKVAVPHVAPYSGSKFALVGLSDA